MLVIYLNLISISLVNSTSLLTIIIPPKACTIFCAVLVFPGAHLIPWGMDYDKQATCASFFKWQGVLISLYWGFLGYRHSGK